MRCLPPASWLCRYLKEVLPLVDKELLVWREKADNIEDESLRHQALDSLEAKAFHCYGGAVMSLLGPKERLEDLVALIVAFQTISDYLDNLCDRAGIVDEVAFTRLHQAIVVALAPEAPLVDFYEHYPDAEEKCYLPALVRACQKIAASLPRLELVRDRLIELVRYYSNLQVLKHLPVGQRQERLEAYIKKEVPDQYGLAWWELAAATGSTLGVFGLMALAAHPDCAPAWAEGLYHAYFPWICGLHILLDYLIDQEEDKLGGDLNFVSYYRDENQKWEALRLFVGSSLQAASGLRTPSFHRLVVTGLLAMYLSDPKVRKLGYTPSALRLMKTAGQGTLLLYRICQLVRRAKQV